MPFQLEFVEENLNQGLVSDLVSVIYPLVQFSVGVNGRSF